MHCRYQCKKRGTPCSDHRRIGGCLHEWGGGRDCRCATISGKDPLAYKDWHFGGYAHLALPSGVATSFSPGGLAQQEAERSAIESNASWIFNLLPNEGSNE
jgi:hypothetical protein